MSAGAVRGEERGGRAIRSYATLDLYPEGAVSVERQVSSRPIRRGIGTLQKDWAVLKSNALSNDLCIVVRGH